MTTANEQMALMLTKGCDAWRKLNPRAYHLAKNLQKFEDVIEVVDMDHEVIYYLVK